MGKMRRTHEKLLINDGTTVIYKLFKYLTRLERTKRSKLSKHRNKVGDLTREFV